MGFYSSHRVLQNKQTKEAERDFRRAGFWSKLICLSYKASTELSLGPLYHSETVTFLSAHQRDIWWTKSLGGHFKAQYECFSHILTFSLLSSQPALHNSVSKEFSLYSQWEKRTGILWKGHCCLFSWGWFLLFCICKTNKGWKSNGWVWGRGNFLKCWLIN